MESNILLESGTNELELLEFIVGENSYGINIAKVNEVMFYQALKQAKRVFSLKSGDNVVLTGGMINGVSGNTNTIKVEVIK